ncbi:MAG TPA: aminotransferase class V-fold PLP-dependent enzyme [Bryobacteraceae bacterium]|nr:aminotransferase class V-fold PLP-dependent enzyme [Bryobacteraceae bacterium]
MRRRSLFTGLAALPAAALAAENPEAYWKRIRDEQFYLPGWRAFLNNGSLGIAPRPVVAVVQKYLEQSAMLAMDEYPRWGYERMNAHRAALASYIGCPASELALTHNATEAMSIVAAGLDLKAGDEVVMTDQEHPSGRGAWLVRQQRHGIRVRQVPLPLPPKDPGQIADLLIGSLGPRTRVLSFSGITTTTGMVLPVRDICRAARAKGVLTLVDGAHMHGQIPFRVEDLECDFMAGSPHKWLFAPAGCGLLYVRKEMQERIWPSITTDAWPDMSLEGARFMQVGTNNRALFEGMVEGLRFAKEIGPERIYARIHQLARTVLERARELPELRLLTPDDDRMFGSLVSFQMDPALFRRFADLCRQRKIWIMMSDRFRVSVHIHTRPGDIDLLFEALRDARKA